MAPRTANTAITVAIDDLLIISIASARYLREGAEAI
jgi:hypothetical protein